MEKDTVCISIKEYERLKKLEQKDFDSVEKAHSVYLETCWGNLVYINTDKEAIFKLAKKYVELKNAFSSMNIDKCSAENQLKDMKSYSIIDFIRWSNRINKR